ncbi:MAG TPA: rRNA adenine methyltransferase [Panacibacter sp.]|nr:rRNA adenine methyltransferase [Panacibacter sp.]HNP47065.1 rRNA adenine methyltransferase [Panacibacter sp.]
MLFDPDNNIVKLCANGMTAEGQGQTQEASRLFNQAWEEASNDFEKFTAAHYVARHQKSVADKLKWDETSLQFALKLNDETIKGFYPSLYLNIAKCYEDMNDMELARSNYQTALSFSNFLPDDGYGKMIKTGILTGITRISK